MNIWIALVGGIILGWVIEWVIDWLFWRRGIAGFYATEAELRDQLAAAQAQNAATADEATALRSQFVDLTSSKSKEDEELQQLSDAKAASDQQLQEALAAKSSVEAQLAEALAAKSAVEVQLEEALAAAKDAAQARRDDLEQVDGIGRMYEQKLFDAGIDTFAQLAVTPVDKLREIIQPASWQNVNFESWVEQARSFAEVVIFDLLPYRLEEIRGIGPTYAKRLNAEGIMTFKDLASTSEKRLAEIIPQRGGLTHDFADWIKQARAFVGLTTGDRPPLPLERIKGIGPVFATRLDLAGIHTYEDLAATDVGTLQELIGVRGGKVANFERWIEEAKADIAAKAAATASESAQGG